MGKIYARRAAKLLDISIGNLRILEKQGIIHATRSSEGVSFYSSSEIEQIKSRHGLTLEEEAARIDTEIQHEIVSSVSRTKKVLIFAGSALSGYILLVVVLTILFIINPVQTAVWLGYIQKNQENVFSKAENAGSSVLAAATSTVAENPLVTPLQAVLQPVGRVSLGLVKFAKPDAYTQVGKVTILDPNQVLALDNTGTIIPVLPIKIPGSSSLNIATKELVENLNSQYLQGKQPGARLGDIAIVGETEAISGLTNVNLSGSAGISNANLANSSVTVSAGSGLSGGGAFSLGGSISLTNAGVTSLAGTTNQVNVSGSTGGITLTLPQNIHSGASPTFAGLILSSAPTATANYGTIRLGNGPFDGTTAGFFTGNANGTQLSINAASGSTGDLFNFQIAGVDKLRLTGDGNIGMGTIPGITKAFVMNRTFTDGSSNQDAFFITTDSTVSSGFSQNRGQFMTIKNSATTTSTGVLTGGLWLLQANGSQNYLTNNFTGLSLSIQTLAGQSGTIVDTNGIRINAPSLAGSKPTSVYGIQIFNQGVSGVTTSTALRIAAQSGSTSNYGITVAGGNSGFGTTTPLEVVDVTGNLQLNTIGNKIKIKEGTNASMGITTLVAGSATVSNTLVTANSRIFLTGQNSSGTAGELTISARTSGTSFTITSSSGTDTRDVAWHIIEPAP